MLITEKPGIDQHAPDGLLPYSVYPCDYYSLKSGFFFTCPWETQLYMQQQFARLMRWWLGPNWRERLLDAD